jgi:hypothetical protein
MILGGRPIQSDVVENTQEKASGKGTQDSDSLYSLAG